MKMSGERDRERVAVELVGAFYLSSSEFNSHFQIDGLFYFQFPFAISFAFVSKIKAKFKVNELILRGKQWENKD